MTISHRTILIVDDDAALRKALAMILADAGFDVYLAADGFSALVQMRHAVPDILLSDLNMPGMSGFELLSIVRRRFPSTRVIAMSGAFTGDQVPPGVAADAFYAKGRSGVTPLIRLAHWLSDGERPLQRESSVPVWIARTPFNLDDANVVITCPECLRVFPQSIGRKRFSVDEAHCMHLFQHSSICSRPTRVRNGSDQTRTHALTVRPATIQPKRFEIGLFERK